MHAADKAMAEYYARRASEYERVYRKPERQADLGKLAEVVSGAFAGQDVLEVACGTGYRTQFVARSARSIVATDVNAEVLNVARRKDYGSCRVAFVQADAHVPISAGPGFTSGFHAFWWSHVPVQRIAAFLDSFHSTLPASAPILMIDNAFVEGSSTPISRRDGHGNTYQMRQLEDGSRHEVLKNFPTPDELRAALKPHADRVHVTQLEYYWIVRYRKSG